MSRHIIIDGNNLLYAMHAHAPIPNVGREAMLRIIERWCVQIEDAVTLVFDGPQPQGGLARQLKSSRIHVRFSAPRTADDLIVDLIRSAPDPGRVRVVTSDGAIIHEARQARCVDTSTADFVSELFPALPRPEASAQAPEKPKITDEHEVDEFLRMMGAENLDVPDDRELWEDRS